MAAQIRASAQPPASAFTRDSWVATLARVADPVLTNLAQRHAARADAGRAGRGRRPARRHAPRGVRPSPRRHGAVARACRRSRRGEAGASRYRTLAQQALASAVDPASPDFLNFTRESQPLVDAAFLAQGLLRAPRALRDALDQATKRRLDRGARVDAGDHARVQQLAAVLGDGRSGPEAARRTVGSDARGLRAAPARAVVQGRRRLRRRPRLPLGLLQQLRHPADAARRARRRAATNRRPGATCAPRVLERARRYARDPGAPDRARRQLPGRSADRSRIGAAPSTCSRSSRCGARCPTACRRRRCAAR